MFVATTAGFVHLGSKGNKRNTAILLANSHSFQPLFFSTASNVSNQGFPLGFLKDGFWKDWTRKLPLNNLIFHYFKTPGKMHTIRVVME